MKIYMKYKEKILYLFFGVLTTLISLLTYYILTFTTPDRDACIGSLLDIIQRRDISERDYELLQRGLIAREIRNIDNKYDYLENFPMHMHISDEYCDGDFYRSVDYQSFMDELIRLDFDTYVTGELVQLKRTKDN